jgi:hypothetical protein
MTAGKPHGPLDWFRSTRENICVDLKEIVCEKWEWIQLAKDRIPYPALLKTVMNHHVTSGRDSSSDVTVRVSTWILLRGVS